MVAYIRRMIYISLINEIDHVDHEDCLGINIVLEKMYFISLCTLEQT